MRCVFLCEFFKPDKLNFRHFLVFITLLLAFHIGYSQIELRGVVIDAKTKEPLAYVNYAIENNQGGTTDDSGRFFMLVNSKTDSVVFSYLGYKDEILKKRFFKKDSIIVKMHLDSYMLEEFTVKAKKGKIPKDTAAIRIFRNVVKNKTLNKPKSYESYQYEEYTKTLASLYNINPKLAKRKILKPVRFVVSNFDSTSTGTKYLPLILKETIKQFYVNKDPKRNKEVVVASKVSGIEQLRFSELLDVAIDDVEAYDNQTILNGKTFLMPFADGGLTLYNYYVIDSAKGADSFMVYNLAFVPKNKGDMLFNGSAKIHGQDYALMQLNLGIDKRSEINWINDFYLNQTFTQTPDGWFKESEDRATSIAFTKRKKAKSVRISRSMHRKDIVTNMAIADTILKQPDYLELKDYRRRKDTFWVNHRHDTLRKSEQNVYILIDSFKNTRFYKAMSQLGGLFASGYYRTKVIDIGSLYQMVSWNDLEGVRLRLVLKNNWRIGKWVNWKVYGAYGINDKKFKYGAELGVNLPDKKFKQPHGVSFAYYDDYQRFTLEGTGLDYDYIYNSFLRRKSIADLIYLKDFRASYNRQWLKNFSTSINFNYKTYETIPGKIEFVKTQPDGITKDTTRSFQIFTPSVNIFYAPGAKFFKTSKQTKFLKGNLPRFNFGYSFSIRNFLGSDFNYHKLTLKVEERLPSPIGHTNITLTGMKLFGNAPYPLLTIHPGNQSFIYDEQRFSNMRETEYIADQQLSLIIEHHFDGFFFNKIPGFRKLGLREVFVTKMAVSSLSPEKVAFSDLPVGMTGLNGFYAEIGFGIENIAKLIRADFSWRLTQRDKPGISKFRWTFSFAPNF